MIKKRINKLKKLITNYNLDGYIVPKNDAYFSEFSYPDRLKTISNFSGSAGFAIILKDKNFLFVDGRYTIQAQIESGKYFKIMKFHEIFSCNLFKNLTLGIDPKIFTSEQIKKFFDKYNKVKIIDHNLVDEIFNKYNHKSKNFYSLNQKIVGESHQKKISKVSRIIRLIYIS